MKIDGAKKSIEDLKSPEGFLYAGLPKFRALFGRDSLISSMELLDHDRNIAMATLQALSSMQGSGFNQETLEEPGKIIHEYQHDVGLIKSRTRNVPWLKHGKNYFSVDSTPLFVILYHMLMEKDPGILEDRGLLDSAIKAISWIVDFGFNGHFLSYMKAMRGFGLQSQSWRDGIGAVLENLKDPVSVVGVQGYAFSALNRGLQIMEKACLNEINHILYERINELTTKLKENFQDMFYLEETGFYAFAVDGDGVAEKTVSSDPGHLLFSGLLNKNEEKIVIDRIFQEDLLTEYGIRCLSTKSPYFDEKAYQRGSVWPHDNFLIAMGLKFRGYHKLAAEIGTRVTRALEELSGMPEYFGVDRKGKLIPSGKMRITPCDPQAWTAGAYYYFNSS